MTVPGSDGSVRVNASLVLLPASSCDRAAAEPEQPLWALPAPASAPSLVLTTKPLKEPTVADSVTVTSVPTSAELADSCSSPRALEYALPWPGLQVCAPLEYPNAVAGSVAASSSSRVSGLMISGVY